MDRGVFGLWCLQSPSFQPDMHTQTHTHKNTHMHNIYVNAVYCMYHPLAAALMQCHTHHFTLGIRGGNQGCGNFFIHFISWFLKMYPVVKFRKGCGTWGRIVMDTETSARRPSHPAATVLLHVCVCMCVLGRWGWRQCMCVQVKRMGSTPSSLQHKSLYHLGLWH